jgi:hypothetical protein
MNVADATANASILDRSPDEIGYHFWDVAVRREGDAAAAKVFDQLVPHEFTRAG